MTALLDHYPILSRVPAEQRAALVTQAALSDMEKAS